MAEVDGDGKIGFEAFRISLVYVSGVILRDDALEKLATLGHVTRDQLG